MKRKVALSVIAITLLGALAYVLLRPEPTMPAPSPDAVSTNTSPSSQTPAQASDLPARSGTYIAYSASALTSTPGTKLLFFHAPWCPQCRALDSDITRSPLPENVTIFKVDYDSNQELRQKYGVTIQTTVVKVDDNGNLVEKYVAYDQPTFAAVRQHLLE